MDDTHQLRLLFLLLLIYYRITYFVRNIFHLGYYYYICNLYTLAMDRKKWTHLVKYVVDTNGH